MLEHKNENLYTFQAAHQGLMLSCSFLSLMEDTSFLCGLTLAKGMVSSKSLTGHPPWDGVRVEANSSLHQIPKTKPDAPAWH